MLINPNSTEITTPQCLPAPTARWSTAVQKGPAEDPAGTGRALCAHLHAVWLEGQVPEGLQDRAEPAEQHSSHVHGHLHQGSVLAAAPWIHGQGGQRVLHQGNCKQLQLGGIQHLGALDELNYHLCLLKAQM